jgi:anti-sigma regulatory factor (Ser/Thr protein kinase)
VQAPAAARRIVSSVLSEWELTDLGDDARLVVSELVSNAVRHASGPQQLQLEVARLGTDGVRIALADGSSVKPIIRELDDRATSGRGLRIVQSLAADWGTEDHPGGKRVWVDLERGGR